MTKKISDSLTSRASVASGNFLTFYPLNCIETWENRFEKWKLANKICYSSILRGSAASERKFFDMLTHKSNEKLWKNLPKVKINKENIEFRDFAIDEAKRASENFLLFHSNFSFTFPVLWKTFGGGVDPVPLAPWLDLGINYGKKPFWPNLPKNYQLMTY